MPPGVSFHRLVAVAPHWLLLAGGVDNDNVVGPAFLCDTRTVAWHALPAVVALRRIFFGLVAMV